MTSQDIPALVGPEEGACAAPPVALQSERLGASCVTARPFELSEAPGWPSGDATPAEVDTAGGAFSSWACGGAAFGDPGGSTHPTSTQPRRQFGPWATGLDWA